MSEFNLYLNHQGILYSLRSFQVEARLAYDTCCERTEAPPCVNSLVEAGARPE